MRISYILIVLCVILISCVQNNTTSYQDYLNDKSIMKKIEAVESCPEKLELFKKIKSLDYQYKFQLHYQKDCGDDFVTFELKNDENLLDIMDDMMVRDQTAREDFNSFVYNHNIEDRFRYAEVFDSMVGKVDRYNEKIFDSLIDNRKEWVGAEYIPRKPGYPKLSVMIGHWSEKHYQKYTLMAFDNARNNKEYWQTVISTVGFSFKYPVNIEEVFENEEYPLYPFRFSEIYQGRLKGSNLTQIEFDYLAKLLDPMKSIRELQDEGVPEAIVEELKKQINDKKKNIVLSSSLDDRKKREKLIDQAEDKLLQLGVEKEQIEKDYSRARVSNKEFKLYYKI